MSDLFDKLGDYLPLFTLIILWVILLPVRAVALLLLPPVNRYSHPLRKVREFFMFDLR